MLYIVYTANLIFHLINSIDMYALSWIFNKSGMEQHKYLKFGMIVVLCGQLNFFSHKYLTVIVIINESFPYTFPTKKPQK